MASEKFQAFTYRAVLPSVHKKLAAVEAGSDRAYAGLADGTLLTLADSSTASAGLPPPATESAGWQVLCSFSPLPYPCYVLVPPFFASYFTSRLPNDQCALCLACCLPLLCLASHP